MATVIISLGSNHRQATHIQWASQWLQTMLTDTTCSRLLWTTDIKGSGIMYMNRLIKGRPTCLPTPSTRCLRLQNSVAADREVGCLSISTSYSTTNSGCTFATGLVLISNN